MSSSLIGYPIHSALCHIEAKSFVNYYYKTRLIIIKKKIQTTKWDYRYKTGNLLNLPVTFISFIVSTRFRNDLHVFKINSSDILFHSSSIAVLSESIFRWELHLFCFLKHFAIRLIALLWGIQRNQEELMEAIKKLLLFANLFSLGFGVKQIIDSLSIYFLFSHIGLNLNEIELE